MFNLSVRTTVVVGLLGLGCGLAFDARAQESDEVDWMRVDVVNVVPQRLDDFLELQLEEVNPALQRAGVPWRSVWRTAEFGPAYELRFITPIINLTDYDTGGPVARVMRPDRFRNLLDRVRSYTVSRDSSVMRYLPELSAEGGDGQETYLSQNLRLEIAPGREAEWVGFLRRSRPRFKSANAVVGVYQQLFGQAPLQWLVVQRLTSFVELAQPDLLQRAFGAQAPDVAAELAGVVLSVEQTVLRYDAELSYSTPVTQ